MQYKKTTLSNGLRILTSPMPSFESATVLVTVGAGSRYETKQNNGISHFLEHMAFKGTENRPSAMDIAGLIDSLGGEFNAFTGKELTGYYIKAGAQHVSILLDVLSDMLKHSKLDSNEIEKEKGVILEEINLYEDTPARKIGDIYEQLLYGDTPLGWDIAGNKDTILKITRDDFIKYMGSLYSSSNIVVTVAGGIDADNVEEMVAKHFGDMSSFDTIKYSKVVENQYKPEVLIRQKETEQVHIALGVRTIPVNHPHRYPLAVLSAVLGGGMSSRLFHEVREKRGLGYYIHTHSDHYEDAGSLVSTAGIDSKRVDEAIKVINEEYQKIRTLQVRVTDEELRKAKEFLKGHLVLELEDSRSVAGFYAHQELLETAILNPDQVMDQIENVTHDQLEEVSRIYLAPEKYNLAVIGNFDDKQRFEQLLK